MEECRTSPAPFGARDLLLIVDDMELNRAILSEAFRGDYQILEAENGLEALSLINQYAHRIAAVLLDVVMPEMDGLQLLEAMKGRELLVQLPVYLVTADCSEEKMHRGYELGVMDIIGKPVVPYFVRRRVSSVVELFQTRERLGRTVDLQDQQLARQALEIQELNRSIIESLATAIEFRSGESGSHVRRISALTDQLLRQLREEGQVGCAFSDEVIDQIAAAAILHDVGKIAIPDQILNKPGRLTAEEFELMKTHTIKGCELLEQIPQYRTNPLYLYAHDICRHHHERWDGRGYPDGLKGEDIPIWAQVVALADVYDALTNERCYKPPFSHQEAMEMILGGQCGVFNPVLLDTFRRLFDSAPPNDLC